ncbi:MAG: FAD/NAD(P)-binding protein [Alphaproteobacteria bacterium]|uniref:FAD/NAD(P)-binding protein n=1 Tax=Brevundimonas sp. TaxID=1871086 RepID=UPI001D501EAE|nr:FAD/NAD(P)-binding protein [Alphaproteobacteria bacterium]MBU1520609.1 FAD/NAD(P)-binding protein [Alphaproteobacteria bacterium]MBU2031832.1 FAD/NAD(P)-binding protein [Alphaproteobacteria bacterium]MBU2166051.1 FAD/NAD(P)-binding protein [Alphaproteobacteria bacterium]MBU2229803.1 FAD/NAD(P)-binding protein [Alphaproteobacteria bacterium]
MRLSIAFVGAGPTTLYTLAALLPAARPGLEVTVFEEAATAGFGSPYRPGWNDAAMLSNIASIEIPPVGETLLSWLRRLPRPECDALGLDPDTADERTFVPRVALGAYFRDQFAVLAEGLRARGAEVEILTGARVIDAAILEAGIRLTVAVPQSPAQDQVFDYAVLATGHQWPSRQEARPGYFTSPWPAAGLSGIAPVSVGIRGSSLTAIDAAIAVAAAHGRFERREDRLVYTLKAGAEGFGVTMMSRKGLLPEADFFFPLPHAPLSILTREAITALTARADDDVLDRAFDLFKRELTLADPAYARDIGLDDVDLETFAERYFQRRTAVDPFRWAEENLDEARRNHADRVTVAWRDAILRMHEVMAAIAPHLTGVAFARFNTHLKPVFVDNYSSVPHESIERMLALHRAGRLEVLALGDDHQIDTRPSEGGAVLKRDGGERRHFPVFVEATGQRALSGLQFPFLTLLEQGVVQDQVEDEDAPATRGIRIDAHFHPVADSGPVDRLFCLSLPFIMGRHPFVQGVTSSHHIGQNVGATLAGIVAEIGETEETGAGIGAFGALTEAAA